MMLADKEVFQAWKEDHRTQEFFQYLKDRQTDLSTAWAEGKQLSPEQQAQAVLLGRLADLSHDDIIEQYAIEQPERDDEQ